MLYARVSSADQREDLDRQVGRLTEGATLNGHSPTEVVKEVGSGLNGSRKRLLRVRNGCPNSGLWLLRGVSGGINPDFRDW